MLLLGMYTTRAEDPLPMPEAGTFAHTIVLDGAQLFRVGEVTRFVNPGDLERSRSFVRLPEWLLSRFLVFDLALYSEHPLSADRILAGESRFAFEFRYLRAIDAEDFISNGWEYTLASQTLVTHGQRTTFLAALPEGVAKHDRLMLAYEPGGRFAIRFGGEWQPISNDVSLVRAVVGTMIGPNAPEYMRKGLLQEL
jgi:hypothetical protein